MMSDEEFTFGMPAQPGRETEMTEQELRDVIESKKAHISWLHRELDAHKIFLAKSRVERAGWDKERKGMCQAVTRANKARNAMGRWTVAIQNENDLLRLVLKDRGINADFMWKAKRALEKVERIREALNEDDLEIVVKSYLEGILDAE